MRMLRNALGRVLRNEKRAAWLCAPVRMAKRALGVRPARLVVPECRRILVIRPDEIGDVVLTSSFLRNLRLAAPSAKISAVVSTACRSLWEHCPYLNAVFSLPFAVRGSEDSGGRHDLGALMSAALRLKLTRMRTGFDLVLLPRADADWYGAEMAAHVLAGRGAVAMNSADFISWNFAPPQSPGLADFRYVCNKPQREPKANLEFLDWCGGVAGDDALEFWHSPKDTAFVETWLARLRRNDRHVVFHPPGSRSQLRRWPAGRSRELIEKLLTRTDFSVVVVGGRQDEWVLEELDCFRNHPRVSVALHAFTLPQLGALIRACGFFVGGDSGPMHIAAAVGARTIGIFGPGTPTRFGPCGPLTDVVSLRYDCTPEIRQTWDRCEVCVHDENRCLTELSADLVMDRFLALINRVE